MSRLTLRLPETLHRQLESLADQEGVSLNQYIVYALAQQSSLRYEIKEVSKHQLMEQRARYEARLQSATIASEDEIDQVLNERERVLPEEELSAEVVEKIRRKFPSSK